MPVEYSAFSIVLIALVMGVGFVLSVMLAVHFVFSWKLPSAEKSMTYECGEDTVGSAWLRFNIRFYLVAIVFLLFEVELVLTMPIILFYRGSWRLPVDTLGGATAGVFALVELLLFVLILVLGLVYVWNKGDLSMIRDTRQGDKPLKRDLMPKRRVVARTDSAADIPSLSGE